MTELIVLGSGGPLLNPRRASSAFLVTLSDARRILVDAGGGTFERLGAAGILPRVIHEADGLTVRAVAVPHGMMPALASRIDHGGKSIVFSGDVQSYHPPLVALAQECDLRVHELALPERETEHGHLHAKPSAVGRVARDCAARQLLLNHIMPELEDELDAALCGVRDGYAGPMVVADDLMRLPISSHLEAEPPA